MLNRQLIRTKVVQNLYCYTQQTDWTELTAQKELVKSCAQTYDLYHVLLQLINEITQAAEIRTENLKEKFFASEEEKNPVLNFVQNKFAEKVFYCKELASYLQDNKDIHFFWSKHSETIDDLYQQIRESEQYAKYMSIKAPSFDDDKTIWRQIFSKILNDNEFLNSCIEDSNLYWVSDLDIVISFVIKTIKQCKADTELRLLPLYDNEIDHNFASKLLSQSIKHFDEYKEMIEKSLIHWDIERVAQIDLTIMQTALAEMFAFPDIPIQVTINEYIELAKEYSTDQSPKFVNGILDEIVKQLKKDNRLLKAVIIK